MSVSFVLPGDELQPLLLVPYLGEGAQNENDREFPTTLGDSVQVAGRLERSAFTSQLTAEELKLREAQRARYKPQNQGFVVRKHEVSSAHQFFPRRIGQIGQGNFTPFAAWNPVQSTAQDKKIDSLISSSRTTQTTPVDVNLRPTTFQPWPDSTDARTNRSNIAQGWKHVRRSIRETETDVVNPLDLDRVSGSENTRNNGLITEQTQVRVEESRRARLEQTKDGKFVQLGRALGSQGKFRRTNPRETASTRYSFAYASKRRNVPQYPSPSLTFDEGSKRREFENSRNHKTSLAENSISAIDTTSPPDIPAARFRSTHKSRKSKSHVSSSPYVGGTLAREDARLNKGFIREKVVQEKDFNDEEIGRIEPKRKKIGRKQSGPPKQIYLPEFITVSNLATFLKVSVEDFGNRLRALGFEATNNDLILDAETAGLIAAEFNYEPFVDTIGSNDLVARPPAVDVSLLPARPPVVTIMGHVDHGKTTLLDWLRKSSVAASEHGGITQHIGAFSVSMPGGRLVTFLDTPGHAAFLSMRQRGANVTDIVILVVAADDSVKPQTIEAIKHAQSAKVPIIVAVSKIDKEEANVERVKHDLARYGVEIEDFGGDTQVVCISGKTGQGMAELEDAAIALADILDMRAETDGQAEGRVLESTRNQGGRIATVLVQRGTITRGDVLVAGLTWAKVRSLRNAAGAQVTAATPGTPVQVDGWKDQPAAGDEVLQAPDEKTAKSVVERRDEAQKTIQMAVDMEAVNEARRLEQEKRELEKRKTREAEAAAAEGGEIVTSASKASAPKLSQPGVKEIYFIIKADVSGSVEAVLNSVSALGNSEICAHVLRSGVGPVTEFDIEHAATAKSHIICFNITVEPKAAHMAEAAGVKIMDHKIIYNLVDDVKAKLSEQLPPIVTQKVLGEAEVAQIFDITIKNNVMMPVAGCKVRNGVSKQFLGTMSALKNVKKNVMEMRKDSDCGMSFEDWTDFRVGDQVQSYEEIVEKRSLSF
ncbi:hypothetical protein MMC29_002400 [Sticta canariensis]|nr:hypothetical protein [Sticta canariensis]